MFCVARFLCLRSTLRKINSNKAHGKSKTRSVYRGELGQWKSTELVEVHRSVEELGSAADLVNEGVRGEWMQTESSLRASMSA